MTDAAARRPGRSRKPAALAAGVVGALLLIPQVVNAVAEPPADGPVFPTEVAPYSWWTFPLQPATIGAASVVYQNGVGVEFLDSPQSVVLGSDGGIYRRLTAAEQATIPDDQGDPAQTLLSADGTFTVVAGAGGQGAIDVVSVADLTRETVPIGEGRSAIPVSIDGSGRFVLLLTSDSSLSPYTDYSFRLHGELTRLDLRTGELRDYGLGDAQAAAISADGSRIVANTPNGLVLVDAVSGAVSDTGLQPDGGAVDGDAWAPDGRSFAILDGNQLGIVDAERPNAVRAVTLPDVEYGSAIGWRDADTVLVHAGIPGGDNASQFLWADTATGETEAFSTYSTGFTGAALAGADVARNLVAEWQVLDRIPDQGPLNVLINVIGGLLLAGLVGLVVWAITPKRNRNQVRRPLSPFEEARRGSLV